MIFLLIFLLICLFFLVGSVYLAGFKARLLRFQLRRDRAILLMAKKYLREGDK